MKKRPGLAKESMYTKPYTNPFGYKSISKTQF